MDRAPAFPTPPRRPAPEECCKRGCDPCIYTYYWNAIERWKDKVRALGGDPDAELARLREAQ